MTGDSAASLRELAGHCRRLAQAGTPDEAVSLNAMADDYERRAGEAGDTTPADSITDPC